MATPINIPVNAQLQNVTQLQRQIQQATQNLRINLISGNSARSLTALSQPLGRLTGQADEFSKSLDAANARVLAFGASVGVVNTLSNAFKALVSSTIEVEKAITAISVVGDQFAGKNKQLSQGLFAVAKATGQSFAEVSKAALEFSRQGLNLEQTLQRTQDALVLTRLTGLDAAKSVDGLTASVNAFSKAGLSTTQILNKLAAVDQAFAVSSADLIEGFNRSAAVAQNAGVTFDELAGIITALQQETSRGGAVIGNALKTIFTRLQDTSTLNQLQNLGVAVQDLEGNLLPARQILQNLAKDVEGLGQITRAGIFKDVAGTFQINQLISLVSDLGKANSVTAKATQVSAGATNEAFIANEKLNQSLDAILNKVANTGKQLGALLGEIGLGDNLKGILDGINSFLEGASNLLQGDDLGSRFAQGIVKGIGSVLTGPGIGLFLAVIAKLSFDLAKFGIQSAKTFFGIGQAARDQQQVQEAIVQTLIRNQSVLSQILNTQGGQNAQAQAFLNILKQEEQVLQNIRTIAGGIAAPIIAQGYRPGPQGLQRRSAGGYLPAQEAADVRRGVGGASPSSQVVAIPNFAFGGGKRGTMIANTSEYIVPNYAGGGSAIFNQDMVKTMGLPSGAQKITASGGFIPNFARFVYDSDRIQPDKNALLKAILSSSAKKNLIIGPAGSGKSTYSKSLGNFITNLSQLSGASEIDILSATSRTKAGGLSKNFQEILQAVNGSGGKVSYLYANNLDILSRRFNRSLAGPDEGDLRSKKSLKGSFYAPTNQFDVVSQIKKSSSNFELLRSAGGFIPNFAEEARDVSAKYALLVNDLDAPRLGQTVSYKPKDGARASYKANIYGVQGTANLTTEQQKQRFSKEFSAESLAAKYEKLALEDIKQYSNAVIGQPISPVAGAKLANKGSIPSLVGSIFESAIISALTDSDLIKAQAERDPNAPFDFKLEGKPKQFNKFFNIPNTVDYIEAKYSDNATTRESFASKIDRLESGKYVEKEGRQKKASSRPFTIRSEADISNALDSAGARAGGFNFRIQPGFENKISPASIAKLKAAGGIQTNASRGYIPNFAASALMDAISREKSAGLSASQIYVDQSPALKSSSNPMGLMVANRRDEPAGGFQGIARARKEGMNPKTYGAANGFIPNFTLPIAPRLSSSGGTSSAPAPAPAGGTPTVPPEVAKGFADTAGKIFLLQSALSFLTGAVGDTQNSFAKIATEAASVAGNISSLILFGNEIKNIKVEATGFKGALGNFAKGLGIAGVAFGVVSEGFKFANFALKEFSGENAKAALASAKLADASGKLALQFDSLSKTRQVETTAQAEKILGSAGYEGFFNGIANIFRSEKLGGGDIGADPEVRKAIAQLLALGASTEEVNKVLQGARKTETVTNVNRAGAVSTQTRDITQLSDIRNGLLQAVESGIGQQRSEQLRQFRTSLSSIDLSLPAGMGQAQKAAANAYGVGRFTDLNPQQKELVKEEIKAQQQLNKSKQDEQKAQNVLNFGERLTLEIAKKRVDSVLEIAKLNAEAVTDEEARIQLQEQTLELSNRQKILNEARLKQLDLEKKKQVDIIDSIGAAIDKAQQGGLNVSEANLKGLETTLQGIDFSKLTEKNYDDLANQLATTYLGGANEITLAQAKNILDNVKEERKVRDDLNKVAGEQIDKEKDRKLQIDAINQALASQLSAVNRITSAVASIGNLNISGIDLESAGVRGQITALQARLQDPNLTKGQQNDINAQINGLEKIVNLNDQRKASEEKFIKTAEIAGKIYNKQQELDKLRASIGAGPVSEETTQKIKDAEEALVALGREQQETNNRYDATRITLDASNKALDIQASLIGKVAGAYASLQQQLEAFRLGAGERVAGAQLEALGATDIDSLAKAGIKTDIEAQAQGIKDNQEYYKFIQEGTRLREIQYDIAVAESETRRRELEYELKYTRELIDLKARGASEAELQAARIRQIEEQRSGRRGFEKGIDAIQDRINNYKTTLGEEIPNLFSQNLAQGLNDAISGAKSLKEALRDAATSFFQAITQRNIQNLADVVTGGIGGFFTKPKTAASGGLISGGSGTKDDVPAMLMGGEYVIKKSAVKKYGSGFFDALNKGGVKGFANGGGVQSGAGGFYVPGDYGEGSIRGKSNLLAFAGQSFTSGQYDRFGSTSLGGASVSLEAESARLTAFGRENSPLFERVQQSKEEAFKVYLDQLNQEKQYRDQLKQMEEAEKQRQKQLVTSVVSAVVSAAVSYGASTMAAGAKNANAAAIASGGKSGFLTGLKGAFTGVKGQGGLANIFSSQATALSPDAQFFKSIGISSSKDLYSGKISLENYSKLFDRFPNLGKTYTYDYNTRAYRASGGMIYGGSGTRDDVPAMLTGGEFVLNNRATRKLGVQNLNRLNAGETVGDEDRSGAVTESLLSKLDELIQATRESSSENVVVNVSSSEAQGPTENTGGTEKELQRKIRQAVLDVIAQEKRLGGSLNKDNR
jgi:TP901 family phage tail tape measure protein